MPRVILSVRLTNIQLFLSLQSDSLIDVVLSNTFGRKSNKTCQFSMSHPLRNMETPVSLALSKDGKHSQDIVKK